jgi:hypothetical protein
MGRWPNVAHAWNPRAIASPTMGQIGQKYPPGVVAAQMTTKSALSTTNRVAVRQKLRWPPDA